MREKDRGKGGENSFIGREREREKERERQVEREKERNESIE